MALLDGLEVSRISMLDSSVRDRYAHLLQLRALGLLIFAGLCCLSVELLCCELYERIQLARDTTLVDHISYLQVEECFLEAGHVCECGVAKDMVQYGQRR